MKLRINTERNTTENVNPPPPGFCFIVVKESLCVNMFLVQKRSHNKRKGALINTHTYMLLSRTRNIPTMGPFCSRMDSASCLDVFKKNHGAVIWLVRVVISS
eukprot:m.131052 g.131052  ORF g.131052 m.131052 type:complete len:102 (+) comp13067_c0_seq1:840-1145(+)